MSLRIRALLIALVVVLAVPTILDLQSQPAGQPMCLDCQGSSGEGCRICVARYQPGLHFECVGVGNGISGYADCHGGDYGCTYGSGVTCIGR